LELSILLVLQMFNLFWVVPFLEYPCSKARGSSRPYKPPFQKRFDSCSPFLDAPGGMAKGGLIVCRLSYPRQYLVARKKGAKESQRQSPSRETEVVKSDCHGFS
jgi:hypothetical protein